MCLFAFVLPRSATVPPFTGVFSLSFFGFTAKRKIEIPMSNHQTRYNYQSLTCFYYLINKPFCWSCFCSSEEFIWSVSLENNRLFIWLLSNFPSEHNAASIEAGTVLCSSHLHNTERFLHANSNQTNIKPCDTQNGLVVRTC